MFLTSCLGRQATQDDRKRPVSARSLTHVLTHSIDPHFRHNPLLFSSRQTDPTEAQASRIHSACPRTARDGKTGPCVQCSTLRALRHPTSPTTTKSAPPHTPQRPLLPVIRNSACPSARSGSFPSGSPPSPSGRKHVRSISTAPPRCSTSSVFPKTDRTIVGSSRVSRAGSPQAFA
jgi:hypothetical protein